MSDRFTNTPSIDRSSESWDTTYARKLGSLTVDQKKVFYSILERPFSVNCDGQSIVLGTITDAINAIFTSFRY